MWAFTSTTPEEQKWLLGNIPLKNWIDGKVLVEPGTAAELTLQLQANGIPVLTEVRAN